MDRIEADYVIVGGGSAGCVLAARLSEDPAVRVLLIEAGGDDRPLRNPSQFLSNLWIQVPVGYANTLKDPKVNWLYETEADASSGGRTHVWPRGKVLGGSSAINAMLYVRGQAEDYDGWAAAGAAGWSWREVLPYFRRAQNQERATLLDDGEGHAAGGPLNVTDMEVHAVSDAAIDAGVEAGLPRRHDLNGSDQEGIGWFQVTQRGGRRCSAATAYLHPAERRPNLRIETGAQVTRVTIAGHRATGVEFVRGDRTWHATARAEVVLAAGAVNTPQLLQLSGIGPGGLLREHGIRVVADSPQVGENLQDHYFVNARYRLKPGTLSINEQTRGWRFAVELLNYAVRRRGLLTLSAAHVGAFVRSRPDMPTPDIQFHILPATMDLELFAAKQRMELERAPGLTIAPCQLRPESRGSIHIRSGDPRRYPAIRPNYLSAAADQDAIVAGLRWARRFAAQPALAHIVTQELDPGIAIDTDEGLLDFAIATGTTIYHPVGTCRMGSDDAAVVDAALRVRGIENLRVVDASVMPTIVSGNTNAPTIMLAERASDLIAGRA